MAVLETDSDSEITPAERQFIVELIRDARLNGILEIQYKQLRLKLSPIAAQTAAREQYLAQTGGTVAGWSTKLPIAGAK